MWKYNLAIILIFLVSCQNSKSNLLANNLNITLSKDSCCIEIKNIESYILEQLTADSLSNEQWQSNLAVYKKVEDDLQDLEHPLTGDYEIINKVLTFIPKEPFVKGETYLVELYLQLPEDNLFDKLKTGSKPFSPKPITKLVEF